MTRTGNRARTKREKNNLTKQISLENENENDDDLLIIRIQGNSLTHNTIGYISLYKVTDLIYSIHYDDSIQRLIFDIDSAEIDLTKKFIIIQEPDVNTSLQRIVFYIPDEYQLGLFLDAQHECQDIANKCLEIATRLRDVYYSGFYSTFKSPDQQIFITDELNALQDVCARRFLESVEHRSIEESLGITAEVNSNLLTQKQIFAAFKHLTNIEPICFYCQTRQPDDEDRFLYIHPYVSMTYQKTPVLMCVSCLENWKVYRDDAQYENELIFPGEINEEICCLCSDSPQFLTLCSNCQRSFCKECLQKILTKKDFTSMIEDGEPNWRCMACTHHCQPHPPLSRDAWRHWLLNSKPGSPTKLSRSLTATPTSSSLKRKNSTEGKLSRQSSRSSFPDLPPPTNIVNSNRSASPTASLSSLIQQNISVSSSGRRRKFNPAVMQYDAPDTPNSLPIQKRRKRRSQSSQDNNYDYDQESPVRSAIMVVDRDVTATAEEPEEFIDQNSLLLTVETPKRKRKSNPKGTRESKGNPNSNTPNSNKIDYYYFHQYLDYINQYYLEMIQTFEKQPKRPRIATEEACFLCKDGGELIECDFKYRGLHQHGGMKRCLKVYHQDCLGFVIPDNVNHWCCPRHFCSNCGKVENIKFTCLFCPISICMECPELFVQKYGTSRYREVEIFDKRACEVSKDTQSMICDNCLLYLDEILKDQPNYLDKMTVFSFSEEKSLIASKNPIVRNPPTPAPQPSAISPSNEIIAQRNTDRRRRRPGMFRDTVQSRSMVRSRYHPDVLGGPPAIEQASSLLDLEDVSPQVYEPAPEMEVPLRATQKPNRRQNAVSPARNRYHPDLFKPPRQENERESPEVFVDEEDPELAESAETQSPVDEREEDEVGEIKRQRKSVDRFLY